MNISNINNFINVKNDILSNGCIRGGSNDISLAKWVKRIFYLNTELKVIFKDNILLVIGVIN